MDDRFRHIAALAATQYSVISTAQLQAHGVDTSTCSKWVRNGLIERIGPRSFAIAGSSPTFHRSMAAGLADLAGFGVAAGRAGARLHGLDDFASAGSEFLLPRLHRRYTTNGLVCSTGRPLTKSDIVVVHGIRCLTAERLIIESPLFGFTTAETENAIDSSIRLRLVAEQRLRTRVIREHSTGINGGRHCSTHSSTRGVKVGSNVGSSASSGVHVSADRSCKSRTAMARESSPASTLTFPKASWSRSLVTEPMHRVDRFNSIPNAARN
jgi:Transcriptional regulator, AbiEi antitoxin